MKTVILIISVILFFVIGGIIHSEVKGSIEKKGFMIISLVLALGIINVAVNLKGNILHNLVYSTGLIVLIYGTFFGISYLIAYFQDKK